MKDSSFFKHLIRFMQFHFMRFLTHNRIQINSKKSFTFTIERTKLYEEKTKQDHI